MKEIITLFLEYLKRPHLYPELVRKIIKNLFFRKSAFKDADKAEVWAESNKISRELFFEKNQLIEEQYDLQSLYPDRLKTAQKKQDDCPVSMGGAGDLNLLYALCEKISAKNVLETGVAYGWSSFAILSSINKRNGTLFSSDMPYMGKNNDKFVGTIVPEELKANWKLFRFADKESLPKIFKIQNEFDLVHYDSDKSYNGRIWAYDQLWPKIRKGGYLIRDDITDNAGFMDWCSSMDLAPDIVAFDDKYIGILIKK